MGTSSIPHLEIRLRAILGTGAQSGNWPVSLGSKKSESVTIRNNYANHFGFSYLDISIEWP